jgi:hypothetical protein
MKKYVSEEFRTYILNKYPALKENDSYLEFFKYLLFGNVFDKDTGNLLLETRFVLNLVGRDKFDSTIEFLEEFRDNCLPNFKWSKSFYSSEESKCGKCRNVIDRGFDQEFLSELLKEQNRNPVKKVHFVTGSVYNRVARSKLMQASHKESVEELEKSAAKIFPFQKIMLQYLINVDYSNTIGKKYAENREHAMKVLSAITSPELVKINKDILDAISEDPTVKYKPSSDGRSTRIWGTGYSAISLHTPVRKALFKGLYDADLRSSQFAIFAALLDCPLSKTFIASGKSIWKEWMGFLGDKRELNGEIKRELKSIMYGIIYGMGKWELDKILFRNNWQRLTSHPIVKELLEKRNTFLEEIKLNKGYYCKITKTWIAYEGRKSLGKKMRWVTIGGVRKRVEKGKMTRGRLANSIASTIMQSIEALIISSIFEIGELLHSKSCNIIAMMHDGVTLSFGDKSKMEECKTKISKAVADKCKYVNELLGIDIITSVEFELN